MDRRPAKVITVAVPTTAGAYSVLQCVGGVLTLPKAFLDSGAGSKIVSLALLDGAKQKIAADIFLFSEAPAALADKAAADFTHAQMQICQGALKIPAANYSDLTSRSVGVAQALGLQLQGSKKNSLDLYAVIVTNGTPTYGANALSLVVGLEQN